MPTVSIVGMRHHKPALALTRNLPIGAALILRAEPTNPYDANAIQVLVAAGAIPNDEMLWAEPLLEFNLTLRELLAGEEWMLGYVPRDLAADLTEDGFPAGRDVEAMFSVARNGAPQARYQKEW